MSAADTKTAMAAVYAAAHAARAAQDARIEPDPMRGGVHPQGTPERIRDDETRYRRRAEALARYEEARAVLHAAWRVYAA